MRVKCKVLAACLWQTSAACADDSDPVTLYGRVYTYLESVEARGGAVPVERHTRLTDQSSRIGVRGKDDFGGGMSAWFQLETAFTTHSPGTFAGRESGVGFQGPWGTFFAGRWTAAFEATQASVDPFGHVGVADIVGVALNQANFARRERNTVQYWSPRTSVLRARLTYAVNEGRTVVVNPYEYSLSLAYVDNFTYVALAYEKHNDLAAGVPTAGSDEDGYGIAAFERFGPVKISAQLGRYTRTGTVVQHSYMVGFEWVFGAHTVLGTYQSSRNGGPVSLATQPSCTLRGAGYRYRFSPRTYVIAQYARIINNASALCSFGSFPISIAEGQDPLGFGIGMRTIF